MSNTYYAPVLSTVRHVFAWDLLNLCKTCSHSMFTIGDGVYKKMHHLWFPILHHHWKGKISITCDFPYYIITEREKLASLVISHITSSLKGKNQNDDLCFHLTPAVHQSYSAWLHNNFEWETGGTNPIRGADTQPGDDGDIENHANVNYQSFWKNIPSMIEISEPFH
jgi:hypothetical protein